MMNMTYAFGFSLMHMALEKKPNLVVMDVSMPRSDGLDATREIRRRDPQARILVVSAFNDLVRVRRENQREKVAQYR